MSTLLEQIKQQIEAGLDGSSANTSGENGHFDVTVIGECFADKSPVQRQKMVYATLNDKISSGEIHAITIKAYTPEQWEQARHLQVGGG